MVNDKAVWNSGCRVLHVATSHNGHAHWHCHGVSESCVGRGYLWATVSHSNARSAKQSPHLPQVAHPAAGNPVVLLPWLVVMRGLKWKHLSEGLIVHMLKYTYAAPMKRDVGSGSMAPYIHLGTKYRWVVSFMLRPLCICGKIHR
jgi:hypothetical protein